MEVSFICKRCRQSSLIVEKVTFVMKVKCMEAMCIEHFFLHVLGVCG